MDFDPPDMWDHADPDAHNEPSLLHRSNPKVRIVRQGTGRYSVQHLTWQGWLQVPSLPIFSSLDSAKDHGDRYADSY